MSQRLACAARDLLHALDAGILGDGHKFHDGDESAFVSALRDALASHNRTRPARGLEPALPFASAQSSTESRKDLPMPSRSHGLIEGKAA